MEKIKEKIDVEKLTKCFRAFSYAFTFGLFYSLFVVASPWMDIGVPLGVLTVFWGITKLIFTFAIVCYYQNIKEPKIGFAGVFMFASTIFTFFPINGFLSLAFEALAISSLSLILFDLNKIFPGLRLSVASGLIFLGVIFSILNNPLMQSLASFSWLFGFLVASNRMSFLTKLKRKE